MNKLLILIILISLSACKVREKNNEIIDPVKPSPYKVLRVNPYVNLPDSLGRGKYKGIAFVEGQIVDSTLKIVNVKVMKLKLQTVDGENFIDYYYGINNTESIDKMKLYVPFFEEYLNSLEIERIEGVSSQGVNIITLPIKF
ncbi:hypothetical protein [Labilibaculum euxinus]